MPHATRAIVIGWAIAIGASRLLRDPLGISYDNSIYLYAAGLLLDGQLPFRDWWELNPPLIAYLDTLPVFVARAASINPIPVFTVSVIAMAVWSALATVGLLRRLEPRTSPFDTLALSVAALIPALTWPTIHSHAFGQRDHLFTMLFLPFLVVRVARWRSISVTRYPAVYGILAGIVLLLKPFYIAVAAACELFLWMAHRRTRALLAPETIAAACAGVAYVAHFLLIHDIGRPFFFELVPLVRDGYSALDASRQELFAVIRVPLLRALPLLAAATIASRVSPLRSLFGPLVCVYLVGNGIYLYHGKAWPHSYHIARQAEALLAAVVCSGVWHWLAARGRFKARIAYGVALSVIALVFAIARGRTPERFEHAVTGLLRDVPRGEYVLVLATDGPTGFPAVVQLELRHASRYLWPFPILLSHAEEIARQKGPMSFTSGPRSDAERAYLHAVADDIRRFRPVLVMIQEEVPPCRKCEGRFTLAQYFRETRIVDDVLAEAYASPSRQDGLVVYRRR